MSNLLKNLLVTLGIAVLVLVGYMIFTKTDTTAPSVPGSTTTEQAALESQALLMSLQKLQSYNVEGKIFSDARFASLVDFRVELVDEPFGRPNPFAPIE